MDLQFKNFLNNFVTRFSFQPEDSHDYLNSDDDSDWSDSENTDLFENDDFVVFSNKGPSLQEINTTWENFHGSDSGVEDQSIVKVHFADEYNLVTVHEVENVMAYFIDCERFKRRILQCEQIITPVLHQRHRQKMFKRNKEMEALLFLCNKIKNKK